MKRFFSSRLLQISTAAVMLPAVAFAHPGHDGDHDLTWDFASGLGHPLFGPDHLLAMLAVGLWVAQLHGRTRWMVPATFVGAMALGATCGRLGEVPPGVEQVIAASLLALGLVVVVAKRLPLWGGLSLSSLFGAFHGFAHGAEIPATSNGISYGLGFIVGTILLHGAGLRLGELAGRKSARFSQAAGAGLAIAGALMLAA